MKIYFQNEYVCTIIGLIVNIILALLKFSAGILGHSQAMIADSINSLSDVFATTVTYITLKLAKKPEDKDHPYGHENIEVTVSVMVSALLLLTGIFIGYSGLHTIIHQHYNVPTSFTLIIAVVSIISKELLFRYTFYVGKKLNSPVIKANAYDHRADVFSSLGSSIGITGAQYGLLFMDPLAGLVIAGFIVKMSWNIFQEGNRIIMDTLPSEDFISELKNYILKYPQVKGYANLRVHRVGRNYIIDVSILVSGTLNVREGHLIANNLRHDLINRKPCLKDIIVHIEPE